MFYGLTNHNNYHSILYTDNLVGLSQNSTLTAHYRKLNKLVINNNDVTNTERQLKFPMSLIIKYSAFTLHFLNSITPNSIWTVLIRKCKRKGQLSYSWRHRKI